jgi:hypothetical protein
MRNIKQIPALLGAALSKTPKEVCETEGHLAIVVEFEQGKYCKWCSRCGERVGSDVPGRIM